MEPKKKAASLPAAPFFILQTPSAGVAAARLPSFIHCVDLRNALLLGLSAERAGSHELLGLEPVTRPW